MLKISEKVSLYLSQEARDPNIMAAASFMFGNGPSVGWMTTSDRYSCDGLAPEALILKQLLLSEKLQSQDCSVTTKWPQAGSRGAAQREF